MPSSLLRHRDFRLLWAGDTISQLGTQVTVLALPLLAITTLHATPFEVGLLTTFEFLAFLLVGLPAGAWVDRMRRRQVMVAADLGRAVLLGSLPLAAWFGVLGLPQLYVVALGTGLLTVFFDVAYQSYLPHLVGRERLVEGNATLQASQSVSQVAGPTAGGLLVQALTAPYAVLVDAVSFLWSAGCVGLIRAREPRPERSPDRHLGREVAAGVRFVFGHRILRAISGCTATFNFFTSLSGAMLLVLLARDLGLSAGLIGLVFSVASVGGLVGALVASRWQAGSARARRSGCPPRCPDRSGCSCRWPSAAGCSGWPRSASRRRSRCRWSTTSPRSASGRACARSGCSAG
ncbi:MAG TPA: MFS transporter [Mycobacteriales bacterium]|nr:MFS transporter [Mycobacteriales bacterium]